VEILYGCNLTDAGWNVTGETVGREAEISELMRELVDG